jgi:hypothetical protein
LPARLSGGEGQVAGNNGRTFDQIMDDLTESIRMSSRGQRWLLSKTFWNLFDYSQRSQQRIDRILEGLEQRQLVLTVSDPSRPFGKERKSDRIILTLVETLPQPDPGTDDEPPDDWFTTMERRQFDSEQEVEYFFVGPLLHQLEYAEEDFVIGHPVTIYEGVRKVAARADFVVVEAKRFGRSLDADVVNQAKSYAMWLAAPYYVVTNGDEIRVYLYQGPLTPETLLLAFNRKQLRENWTRFHGLLNRSAVVEYKREVAAAQQRT